MEVMAVPKRSLNGTVLRRLTLCEEVNGLERVRACLICSTKRHNYARIQYETYNDRNSNTPRCPK